VGREEGKGRAGGRQFTGLGAGRARGAWQGQPQGVCRAISTRLAPAAPAQGCRHPPPPGVLYHPTLRTRDGVDADVHGSHLHLRGVALAGGRLGRGIDLRHGVVVGLDRAVRGGRLRAVRGAAVRAHVGAGADRYAHGDGVGDAGVVAAGEAAQLLLNIGDRPHGLGRGVGEEGRGRGRRGRVGGLAGAGGRGRQAAPGARDGRAAAGRAGGAPAPAAARARRGGDHMATGLARRRPRARGTRARRRGAAGARGGWSAGAAARWRARRGAVRAAPRGGEAPIGAGTLTLSVTLSSRPAATQQSHSRIRGMGLGALGAMMTLR
jgi:hypothetical protein